MLRPAVRPTLALATLALSGCMLDWNSLRADARAPADTMTADIREPEDTGVLEDTGVPEDSGVDTGVRVDSGVDTGVLVDTGVDTRGDTGVVTDTGVDTGVVTDTGVDTGVDTGIAPGCDAPVVVNEVQSRTVASGADDFVELRNNGTCTVDLTGWRVIYWPASGTAGGSQTLYSFVAGDRIAPGEHLLLANSTYAALSTTRRYSSGIADSGSVGVSNRTGRVDSVAFGALAPPPTGHPFAEPIGPVGAPSPPPGQSISRSVDGRDTNNNAMDFRVTMTPTPGAPNS